MIISTCSIATAHLDTYIPLASVDFHSHLWRRAWCQTVEQVLRCPRSSVSGVNVRTTVNNCGLRRWRDKKNSPSQCLGFILTRVSFVKHAHITNERVCRSASHPHMQLQSRSAVLVRERVRAERFEEVAGGDRSSEWSHRDGELKSVQRNAELDKHTRVPDARVTLRHSNAGEMKERAGHLLVHVLSARQEVWWCEPSAVHCECVFGYSGTQGKRIGPNSGGRNANNANPAHYTLLHKYSPKRDRTIDQSINRQILNNTLIHIFN